MNQKGLTIEQREFLIYLRDYHRNLGFATTIRTILKTNHYSSDVGQPIHDIVRIFRGLVCELKGGVSVTEWQSIATWNKPFKYIK